MHIEYEVRVLEIDKENMIKNLEKNNFKLQFDKMQKRYVYDFNPVNPHLWNVLGVTAFQLEEYDEASNYFEQAVSINPYYTDALYNLRDTYSMLNNAKGEAACDARIRELGK